MTKSEMSYDDITLIIPAAFYIKHQFSLGFVNETFMLYIAFVSTYMSLSMPQ